MFLFLIILNTDWSRTSTFKIMKCTTILRQRIAWLYETSQPGSLMSSYILQLLQDFPKIKLTVASHLNLAMFPPVQLDKWMKTESRKNPEKKFPRPSVPNGVTKAQQLTRKMCRLFQSFNRRNESGCLMFDHLPQ
jgi:hypothetical protein